MRWLYLRYRGLGGMGCCPRVSCADGCCGGAVCDDDDDDGGYHCESHGDVGDGDDDQG